MDFDDAGFLHWEENFHYHECHECGCFYSHSHFAGDESHGHTVKNKCPNDKCKMYDNVGRAEYEMDAAPY